MVLHFQMIFAKASKRLRPRRLCISKDGISHPLTVFLAVCLSFSLVADETFTCSDGTCTLTSADGSTSSCQCGDCVNMTPESCEAIKQTLSASVDSLRSTVDNITDSVLSINSEAENIAFNADDLMTSSQETTTVIVSNLASQVKQSALLVLASAESVQDNLYTQKESIEAVDDAIDNINCSECEGSTTSNPSGGDDSGSSSNSTCNVCQDCILSRLDAIKSNQNDIKTWLASFKEDWNEYRDWVKDDLFKSIETNKVANLSNMVVNTSIYIKMAYWQSRFKSYYYPQLKQYQGNVTNSLNNIYSSVSGIGSLIPDQDNAYWYYYYLENALCWDITKTNSLLASSLALESVAKNYTLSSLYPVLSELGYGLSGDLNGGAYFAIGNGGKAALKRLDDYFRLDWDKQVAAVTNMIATVRESNAHISYLSTNLWQANKWRSSSDPSQSLLPIDQQVAEIFSDNGFDRTLYNDMNWYERIEALLFNFSVGASNSVPNGVSDTQSLQDSKSEIEKLDNTTSLVSAYTTNFQFVKDCISSLKNVFPSSAPQSFTVLQLDSGTTDNATWFSGDGLTVNLDEDLVNWVRPCFIVLWAILCLVLFVKLLMESLTYLWEFFRFLYVVYGSIFD